MEGGTALGGAGTATQLGPLCIAYSRVKSYARLYDCIEKLEARIAAGDNTMKHVWWTVSAAKAAPLPAMLRAEASLELGDFDRAVEHGRRALSLVPEGGYDNSAWPPVKYRLVILANLAVSLALAGRDDEARQSLRHLDAEAIPFAGRSNWLPVRKQGLARAYMATRQWAKVIESLETSAFDAFALGLSDAASRTAWVGREDSIRTIFELPRLFMSAKARLELGDVRRAKSELDLLLSHGRIADFGDIHWLALYERGRIAMSEGAVEQAIELWRRAIELIEAQRASLTTEANKIGFAADKQAVYYQLIDALFARDRHAEAFEFVERAKSRALVDLLAAHPKLSAAAPTPAVGALIEEVDRQERAAIALLAPPGVRRAAARAREAVASVAPELASLITVSSAPVKEVQAKLRPEEALVQYHYDTRSLFTFVLTRETLHARRAALGSLEGDVHDIRRALALPGNDRYLPVARRLHDRLVLPVADLIGGHDLVIVGHGALHYLPFGALHDGETFLVQRHGISFLPSASIVRYLRDGGGSREKAILALGNPDLGDPRMDLHFAEAEAREVAKTMPGSRLLVRRDASLKALQTHAPGFRFLHVASHGKFDPANPLGSALLLSREADDDGLLTVARLYSLRLDAELVALSACETGLAKVAGGDELIGLTRGFLYAGAASILASLWQVDDEATARLMTRFYEKLAAADKRQALRHAQNEVRARYPHPFYWAAFQLTGSPR